MPDYLYDRPPLIEVIAEVHWSLQKIASVPQGGIDPFYDKCLESLRNNEKLKDYRYEEKLVPDGVPIEFFPNQPLRRFRPSAKAWPLFQLGPGVFVANLVPPYRGWTEFRSVLNLGFEALLEGYPAPSELLKLNRLDLKYIDAFTKQHNYSAYARFVREGLQMSLQVPQRLVEAHVAGGEDNVTTIFDVAFPLKNLPNSTGHIKVSPGKTVAEEAVIAQFTAIYRGNEIPPKLEDMLTWFDAAHLQVRSWFEIFVSEPVRGTFGNKTEI